MSRRNLSCFFLFFLLLFPDELPVILHNLFKILYFYFLHSKCEIRVLWTDWKFQASCFPSYARPLLCCWSISERGLIDGVSLWCNEWNRLIGSSAQGVTRHESTGGGGLVRKVEVMGELPAVIKQLSALMGVDKCMCMWLKELRGQKGFYMGVREEREAVYGLTWHRGRGSAYVLSGIFMWPASIRVSLQRSLSNPL